MQNFGSKHVTTCSHLGSTHSKLPPASKPLVQNLPFHYLHVNFGSIQTKSHGDHMKTWFQAIHACRTCQPLQVKLWFQIHHVISNASRTNQITICNQPGFYAYSYHQIKYIPSYHLPAELGIQYIPCHHLQAKHQVTQLGFITFNSPPASRLDSLHTNFSYPPASRTCFVTTWLQKMGLIHLILCQWADLGFFYTYHLVTSSKEKQYGILILDSLLNLILCLDDTGFDSV